MTGSPKDLQVLIEKVERDIYLINNWLDQNELQVNASKTGLFCHGALQT
jgi:hypothetical protein